MALGEIHCSLDVICILTGIAKNKHGKQRKLIPLPCSSTLEARYIHFWSLHPIYDSNHTPFQRLLGTALGLSCIAAVIITVGLIATMRTARTGFAKSVFRLSRNQMYDNWAM